jgi:putative hydrolase of the HAD superfamily
MAAGNGAAAALGAARGGHRALLLDYGGVMTGDSWEPTRAFCRRMGLPPDTLIRECGVGGRLHELACAVESGAMPTREFERQAAGVLGLGDGEGFVADVYGGLSIEERMLDSVRRLHIQGVRTALVSNSWGSEMYALDRIEDAFDALVISAEVGIRKPDRRIYALAARRLGVQPRECVVVDDLGQNLKPARELGMHTILHRDVAATITEVERLFEAA